MVLSTTICDVPCFMGADISFSNDFLTPRRLTGCFKLSDNFDEEVDGESPLAHFSFMVYLVSHLFLRRVVVTTFGFLDNFYEAKINFAEICLFILFFFYFLLSGLFLLCEGTNLFMNLEKLTKMFPCIIVLHRNPYCKRLLQRVIYLKTCL